MIYLGCDYEYEAKKVYELQKAVGRRQKAKSRTNKLLLPSASCLRLTVFNYPSTTHDFLAAIKNCGLSRCDCTLWLVEFHVGAIVW